MATTINATREQAIEASRRYLHAKGYEVEGTWEQGGMSGLVASDDEGLAFVQVQCGSDDGSEAQEEPEAMRYKYERAAIDWLADNEERCGADFSVRFDIISLLHASSKRALLRHQLNVFGTC